MKVYHLNIGQPDLPSPQEGLEALKHIDRTTLEYSPSEGLLSLREKLAAYYKRFNIDVDVDDIIVTTGGSEAVLFAFMACLDPGDEIIVPEPAYANYMAFAISAGAKIVTVNHYINGKYYTSQYVHLSWFAKGLHVGQKVTTDTVLGGMGATGIATGIHLHLTVMDCNLYSPKDPNCSTLGKFYNYARVRVGQGFKGLDSLRKVPYSWYSR